MNAARFISFWVGFCSLSLEIAWVRLYGYANNSTPKAFAFVLGIYLLGIAVGAQAGKRICKLPTRGTIEKGAVLVLLASAPIALLSPWLFYYSNDLALDEILAPLAIFMTAASLSVLFPITHHLGTPEYTESINSKKGKNFSRVYMLNVLGAALGPLITGYVLLENLTMTQIFPVLALLLTAVALISWWMFGGGGRKVLWGTALVAVLVTCWGLFKGWESPYALSTAFATESSRVVSTNENRHGIITISEDPSMKHRGVPFVDYSVYGGNVYDGKINVSLERNTNGLQRPLALHVLQPKAKRVLILGLSIGSWLTVVEGFPGIEAIDVVEINPGYLNMAKKYGPQSRSLQDPRVNVVIDDARRWLQYHPDRKYDLILMNTTFHWRANSSMLLSQEMMNLASKHLSSQGILAFNATGSVDAFYTASTVFKETRRYHNFIYAANWNPFEILKNPDAWNVLESVTVDGHPAFQDEGAKIKEFREVPFVDLMDDLKKLSRKPAVITDDNMLVEYKFGRKF